MLEAISSELLRLRKLSKFSFFKVDQQRVVVVLLGMILYQGDRPTICINLSLSVDRARSLHLN